MSAEKPVRREELLVDSCDGCGRPDGVKYLHRDEHLCPRCGNMYDAGDLASLHLKQLLEPILPAWRAHWLARGVEAGFLNELLGKVGDEHVTTALAYNEL